MIRRGSTNTVDAGVGGGRVTSTDSQSDTDTDSVVRETRRGNKSNPRNVISDVGRRFKEIVDCRDRRYGLTTYENCFIASDAVDAMLYHGLAADREEAVILGQRLADELFLFVHVTGDHHFQDEHLFFHFTEDGASAHTSGLEDTDDEGKNSSPGQLEDIQERVLDKEAKAFREAVKVSDRRYRMTMYRNVFVGSEAVDALVYNGVCKTRWEAVQMGRKLMRKFKLFHHSHHDHEFKDSFLFYRYAEIGEIAASGDFEDSSKITQVEEQPKTEIAELAEAFSMYVDIRDRRYRTRVYRECFIGREAVDALMYAGVADSREKAVEIGRMLEKELRLFQHVTGDHVFKDGHYFYRLRSGSKSGNSVSGHASKSDLSSRGDVSTAGDSKASNLQDKAQTFIRLADVQDRVYHLKTYPNVFVGCEMVDTMVYSGLAKNRMHAVQLGRALARDLNLFSHVTGSHAFSDEHFFYRFKGDGDGNQSVSSGSSFRAESKGESQPDRSADGSIVDLNNMEGISELGKQAEFFKSIVTVSDRKYRLKTYKSVFVGSHAVDAMLEHGMAQTRDEAVELGKTLQKELRLFHHACDAHQFADDYLFFRYRDGNASGSDGYSNHSFFDGSLSISSAAPSDLADLQHPQDDLEMVVAEGGVNRNLSVVEETDEVEMSFSALQETESIGSSKDSVSDSGCTHDHVQLELPTTKE
ncbi:MAG: hypothetical protein SGILL_004514 [Bacillariaceae sp.]